MATKLSSTPAANGSSPIDSIADLLMGEDSNQPDGIDDDSIDALDDALSKTSQDGSEDAETLPDDDDDETPDDDATDAGEDDDPEPGDDSGDEASGEVSEAGLSPGDEHDVAELLGVSDNQVSIAEDGVLMLNVNIDGTTSKHSLADVIKSYQTEGSVTIRSKALADERKTFETAVETKALEIQNALKSNQQLAQILGQELMKEYNDLDWDNLRQYDPAEWSAKQQEFNGRGQKLQALQEQMQALHQGELDKVTQAQEGKKTEYIKSQWGKMLDSNPAWADEPTYEKDMGGLRDFAKDTYGFSTEDFNSVYDARIIEMVKDAQAFRKGTTAAVTKKKGARIPRVQKRNGIRKAARVSKLDKLTKASRLATGSNKKSLQADAVAELLTGG